MDMHKALQQKFNEWMRVLKITRKPDREEFTMSAKVTGAGILLIGAIGFVIYFTATMIRITMRASGG